MAQDNDFRAEPASQVAELALFFPESTPVHIPVRIETEAGGIAEETVLEFGTSEEVLFASSLPLEFGERIALRNPDGSIQAKALVIALQFRAGRTAVAVRFTERVPNWIVKR